MTRPEIEKAKSVLEWIQKDLQDQETMAVHFGAEFNRERTTKIWTLENAIEILDNYEL